MARSKSHEVSRLLEGLAQEATVWTGSSWAFILAFALTALWLVTGPIFRYSDTWQLVMNTISSVVTFLMVFLLQRAQNKDALAMQLKLNEIIAALEGASNRMINVEDLSEEEVRRLHQRYGAIMERAKNDQDLTESLSIEQMEEPGVTKSP
jgi:low affinity Fe/Cu permease